MYKIFVKYKSNNEQREYNFENIRELRRYITLLLEEKPNGVRTLPMPACMYLTIDDRKNGKNEAI